MKRKWLRCGKWLLSLLYVLYIAIVNVNIWFQLRNADNALISKYGPFGYALTYGFSFFLASGFFIVCTIIQAIFYHAKKKKVTECFVLLLSLEAIKILGTAVYILEVDCANLYSSSIVAAFIITGITIFSVISVLEILFMILMKIAEKKICSYKETR